MNTILQKNASIYRDFKRALKYLIFVLFFAHAHLAAASSFSDEYHMAYNSLFFTKTEIEAINKITKSYGHKNASYLIPLSAIYYYEENDWLVRLQNMNITPQTSVPDFKILSVKPNAVTIQTYLIGNDTPQIFILQPRQTLNRVTGEITSG